MAVATGPGLRESSGQRLTRATQTSAVRVFLATATKWSTPARLGVRRLTSNAPLGATVTLVPAKIRWRLSVIRTVHLWPFRLRSPGALGWFAWTVAGLVLVPRSDGAADQPERRKVVRTTAQLRRD